jgi:hypothetical protein
MQLGADPARDAMYRRFADRISRELVSSMTGKHVVDILSRGQLPGMTVLVDGSDSASVGLSPFRFNFRLAPPPHGSSAAAAFEPRSMTLFSFVIDPVMNLEIFQSRAARKMIEKEVPSLLAKQRNYLVHEIIHMLDFLRGHAKIEEHAKRFQGAGFIKYINTPHEFNAFFQQAIESVESKLRAGGKTIGKVDFDRVMKTFKDTESGKEMLRSMNETYMRKLLSRLWQIWDHATKESNK